jgi:GT2 family glycosyltransferase
MTLPATQISGTSVQPVQGSVGIVLIGRNEGDRLKACLQALAGISVPVVYVDSGSTDGSVELATAQGADVVRLDLTIPFTAARARNAGFDRLMERTPELEFVHFIDGDCILEAGWLGTATGFMAAHPDVAVVCGIRREIHPGRSIYNWICDIEWNQPPGETTACGGDSMFRVHAFRQVSGFNPALLSGEEPELCKRIREKGWRVWRLADVMTRHDAAILHFSQYWKRAVRSGYGHSRLALANWKTGAGSWLSDTLRALLYTFLLASVVPLSIWFGVWGLVPLALLTLQVVRIALRRGASDMRSWKYAAIMTTTKLAEAQGIYQMLYDVLAGKTRKIIEYK